MRRALIAILALLWALPAWAQIPGPNIGIGVTPISGGTVADCLVVDANKKLGQQVCGGGTAADITVGTTTVSGGTDTYLLFNNAGILGNKQPTGSGLAVLQTSPSLITPALGVATATSLNGLTITTSTGTLTIPNSASLITSGAFSTTLTSTNTTNVTLPTSGTLATVGGALGSPSATAITFNGIAWASLPSASGLTAGTEYYVNNVGTKGSKWFSDGTRWKPLNGHALLATLDAASSGVNGTATIIKQYQMPAALWVVGDRIRVMANVTKTGTTNTAVLTVYVGTLGTTSDPAALSATVVTAAQHQGLFMYDILLASATTTQALSNGLGYGTANTNAYPGAVTISNVSNSLWVSVGITGGATDAVIAQDVQIEYRSSAN